jgi:GLPGLI family protein
MKLLVFNLFSFFFVISFAFGQKDNFQIGKIHYEFYHLKDTTKPSKFYKEEMLLIFSKDVSQYKSYTKILSDSLFKAQLENSIKEQSSDNINIGRLNLKGSSDEFFYFKLTNKLFHLKPFRRINYIISDSFPKIIWSISDSTKSIGGYNCQKATTRFRGRDYEAWFTQDLPFPFGPWKLHGLPGIIMEANDSQHQVFFKFKEIEKEDSLGSPISFPSPIVMTSENELLKTINAYREGITNVSKTDNIEFTLKRVSGGNPAVKKSNTFNNPIERGE